MRLLQIKISLHRSQIRAGSNRETNTLHDDLHGNIVRQHLRKYLRKLFIPRNLVASLPACAYDFP
jgi:hypothetical protein